MDPKAIYNASNILQKKVNWVTTDENEWIHTDTGDEFREKLVREKIVQVFNNSVIYVVIDRRRVFQIHSSEALPLIREHLKQSNVILWDKDLKRAMFFNSIGVFKFGQVAA